MNSRNDTRSAGMRSRLTRAAWTALAVALTAILLPAAISLAKTGDFGPNTIVGAITGAKPKSEKKKGDVVATTDTAPDAAAAARRDDDVVTPLLDDAAVEDRLDEDGSDDDGDKGRSTDDRSSDDDESDDKKGRSHRPTDDGERHLGDDDDDSSTSDEASDDSSTDGDDAADDNPSADDTSGEDRGKGNDDPAPHRPSTPAPTSNQAAVQPTAVEPVVEATPAVTEAPAVEDTTVAPVSDDTETDGEILPAVDGDGRRQFKLDPAESASLRVEMPEGEDRLTLWARAAGAECAPRFSISVDGTLSGVVTLAGTDWQEHAIDPVPTAGTHTVRILALGTDAERTDAEQGCADAAQDAVTVVEPKPGDDGAQPPADAATVATDDTATTGTDDGTADQGSGDDATDPGTDDGTADQGSGDATTDDRRRFSLLNRESISLMAAEATDGGPLTLWLRSSGADCRARVALWADGDLVDVVDVRGAEWQDVTVEVDATGSDHRISLSFFRLKGKCDGTETLTVVEPKGGDEGTATPLEPVTPTDATSPTNETPSTDAAPFTPTAPSSTPSSSTGGGGNVLWGSNFEDGNLGIYKTVRKEGSGENGSHVITNQYARSGSSSMKITLPAATSAGTVGRYQLVANMPDGEAGQDRWYGFSILLGSDWDLSQVADNRDYFLNGIGFRYTGTSVNGPGSNVEADVVRGVASLGTGTNLANTVGATDYGRQSLGTLVKGRWIDLVYHIKWSTGSDGFREVWRDGVSAGRYAGATLGTDSPFEHRMGFYEGVGVDQTRTLYVDNHRVGTSYAAVDPSR